MSSLHPKNRIRPGGAMLARAAAFALGQLIAGCTSAPPTTPVRPLAKTALQQDGLKGPVRTVATTFVERDEKAQPFERALGSSTYDQAGNLVESQEFTADFVKTRIPERKDANTTVFHSIMGDSTVHYTFNERGNVVEEQVRYGIKFDGPADTITRYKYDSAGFEIERDFIGPDGKPSGVSTYKNDDAGNVLMEDEWLNDPAAPHAHFIYRYDFDKYGNWTNRFETLSGVPKDSYHTGTLIRTITYFRDQSAAAAASQR
jgi:hypothetical protein